MTQSCSNDPPDGWGMSNELNEVIGAMMTGLMAGVTLLLMLTRQIHGESRANERLEETTTAPF